MMPDLPNEDVQKYLRNRTFFHGTPDVDDVTKIAREGFCGKWRYEDEVEDRDGVLGKGIYLTCDWKTALWYGNLLMQVTVKKGTIILDASLPPDRATIKYLRKEFGAQILSGSDVRKVIPHNKHLRRHELTAVLRYHYHKTWEKDYGFDKETFSRWPKRRQRHEKALKSCVSMLRKAGFHGYGNPADENGIVIFAPERIVLEELTADIPEEDFRKMDFGCKLNGITFEYLRGKYHKELSQLACRSTTLKEPGSSKS